MGHYGGKFLFIPEYVSKWRYAIGQGNPIMVIDAQDLESSRRGHLHQLLDAVCAVTECGSQVNEAGYCLVRAPLF